VIIAQPKAVERHGRRRARQLGGRTNSAAASSHVTRTARGSRCAGVWLTRSIGESHIGVWSKQIERITCQADRLMLRSPVNDIVI
jgi:hypothetical protein